MLLHDMMLNRGGSALKIFVAQGSNSSFNLAEITVSLPTNISNDMLLSFYTLDDTSDTITAPVGWTDVASGSGPANEISFKTSNGSEPATATFSSSTVNRDQVATVASFRGVSTRTVGTHTSSSPVTTLSATGITMPAEGILLAYFPYRGTAAPAPALSSGPSGMTLLTNQVRGEVAHAIYYQENVSSGPTGNKTITLASSGQIFGVLIGLT